MRVRADGHMAISMAVVARPTTTTSVVSTVVVEESHGHRHGTFSDLDQLDVPEDGIGDKGKRRTDHRCDSSESSDSGVATLSPSTSDSLELISPYSPCDLSSLEPSDLSCGSGSPPSSSSSSSSSSLCDLGPELEQEAAVAPGRGLPIMAAIAAPKPVKVPAVTNFISFQIPQAQQSSGFGNGAMNGPLKFIEPKNVGQSNQFHCDVRKFATGPNSIKKIIAALGGFETGNGSTSGTNDSAGKVVVVRNSKNISTDLKTSGGRTIVEFGSKNGAGSTTRSISNLRGTGTKSYVVRGEGQPNKVIILSGFPKVGGLPNPTTVNVTAPKANPANAPPPKSKTCSLSSTTTTTKLTSKTNANTNKILVDLTEDDDDEETRPSSSCSPAKKKVRLTGPPLLQEIIPTGSTGIKKKYSQNNSSSSISNIPHVHSTGPKKTDPTPEVVEVSSSTSCKINHRSPPLSPPKFHSFGFSARHPSEETCISSTASATLTVATPDSSTSEDHEIVVSKKSSSLSFSGSSTSSNSSASGSPTPSPSGPEPEDHEDVRIGLLKIDTSLLPTSSTSNCSSSIRGSANINSLLSPSGSISRKRKLSLDDSNSVKSSHSTSSSNSNSNSNPSRTLSAVSTTNCNSNSNDSTISSISPPASVIAAGLEAVPVLTVKKSERVLAKTSTNSKVIVQEFCMWKDCTCATETNLNFLEHIQTVHVAPQTKGEGFVCLWEGCKVFNKKSCSLSWLERHVLSHGGNKPFRCIFQGCGLCFSAQGALERHVNSHIITNGQATGTNGNSSIAKKLDSSPSKNSRRKKIRGRKQKLNTGHVVDFFDKRTMEVIKHRLSSAFEFESDSIHNCTFKCQVLSRRTTSYQEPHVFVRWYPEFVFPDEWIPLSKYVQSKDVPLRQIPPDKIRILFPNMFPPERKEKASRKWKPKSNTTTSTTHRESSSPLVTVNKRNWKDTKLPAVSCGCHEDAVRPDGFTPLDSDWALFLAERFGT